MKVQLREGFERQYTYERLVVVRTIATKRWEHEQLKEKERGKVDQKIREYEAQKAGGYLTGLKSMFGFG